MMLVAEKRNDGGKQELSSSTKNTRKSLFYPHIVSSHKSLWVRMQMSHDHPFMLLLYWFVCRRGSLAAVKLCHGQNRRYV